VIRHAEQDQYLKRFDKAIAQVVEIAERDVWGFAKRLADENLTAADLTSVEDLNRLPILTKDDLLVRQHGDPPFGWLVAPQAQIQRIFQSPGPIYEPQFATVDHWGAAPALRAAGFSGSDVVLNCFAYHLTPAGALFEDACFALGATVVPGGIGSKDLQVRVIADVGVTAYTGTPTYLKALDEQFTLSGFDPAQWRIERALVTAEPLPDSLRSELSRRVPTVQMAYGTAETGILAFEDAPGSGLKVRDDVLVQICDVETGQPIADGEGQIVVTLMRPEYPLIRFGTGDISAWAPSPDGWPRLVGVLGRLGQGVKVRGMFLHPAQIQRVLGSLPDVASYRMVVERREHRDELRCEVVVDNGARAHAVTAEVAEKIRSGLRFSAEVVSVTELVPGMPIIDDRRAWD
jgi:phenylacetate-CoA ligase